MGGDDDNDGDHMKDAGLGLPTGAKLMTLPHFTLESGITLKDVPVGYSTYGTLNRNGTNGVIVGHSLTSNSHVHEWWGEILGPGDQFTMNTNSEYIICVNYLGSCYGTASPITIDPKTNKPYSSRFPTPCTIRDNVRLQKAVLDRLGVRHLKLAIGGSMGSMVALEWAATYPTFVDQLILIAGCGRHSDWAIAIGEAERFAIYADSKYKGGHYDLKNPPSAGLAAARMTAMLTYRAPKSVDDRHNRSISTSSTSEIIETENSEHKELKMHPKAVPKHLRKTLPRYDVESYLRYQGSKFSKRFDPNCYVQLTHTLDTHDVSRERNLSYEDVLQNLRHKTLVVGITSDALYPIHLQQELYNLIPNAQMFTIHSKHGHDAFLIESDGLNKRAVAFRKGEGSVRGGIVQPIIPYPADGKDPVYGKVDELFIEKVKAALKSFSSGSPVTILQTHAEKLPYQQDMGHQPPAVPDLVVVPTTTEQVSALVKLCHTHIIPVTTRGAGTGLEGGAIAYQGGVVCDTSNLKGMRYDSGERTATVGAGVLKNELDNFLKPHGVLFGPDPSSNPSIGGMASTGGSGMSTLKYGTSKENIRSMVVVTPEGRILRTRRNTRKNATGYELNALYLGAEGTLGIITELALKTFPRPKKRIGAVVTFPDVRSASNVVAHATKSTLETLLRCELLNDEGVRCTNAVFGTKLTETVTLFLEFISAKSAEDVTPFEDWEQMKRMCSSHGATSIQFASDGNTLDALWDARRGCYLAALKYRGVMDGSGKKEKVYVGDVCVPVSKLAQCASETEQVFKQSGFPCVMCAHIADGNFHCLVPFADDETDKLERLNDLVVNKALQLGGVASGEHGVGVGKMKHLVKEHGPVHVDTQRRIKNALDPRNIMNPGKVVSQKASEEERRARDAAVGGPKASKL